MTNIITASDYKYEAGCEPHTALWDGAHIKFWLRATLTALLEKEGFEVIGFHGCCRAPHLWQSMTLVGKKKT